MNPLILGLALLAGFCAAGLVWYGWALGENLAVIIKRPKRFDPDDDESEPTS